MSDTSSLFKTAARRAGQFITIVALIFLALALYRQWSDVSTWQPTPLQIGLLIILAFAYSAALMLLAFNWATIIGALVADTPPRTALLLSYTRTQIAKYVPGNIVHLVGRHLYLRDRGVDHRTLATAAMMELSSLPLAATIAIGLFIPVIGISDFGSSAITAFVRVLPVAVVAGIVAVVLFLPKKWRVPLATVLIRGTGFMLAQGVIFAIILATVTGNFAVLAISAAILAWLVGFLTPGAPGGIAVREAVLVGLLGFAGMQEGVLLAAVLMRLVTTSGDLVLFLIGNSVLSHLSADDGRKSDG